MKYVHKDYLNDECTWKQYVDDIPKIQLEEGKKYVRSKGRWDECVFKVLTIVECIAVVKEVKGTNSDVGLLDSYDMYYAKNGFRYNDNRIEHYRLEER